MALVYRANVNFCSLFNTFCSKGISNIKRLASEYKYKHSDKLKANDKISGCRDSFNNMITFRQAQADRSVLIRVKSFRSLHALHKFCQTFGPVTYIFPYNTITNECFVLVEFASSSNTKRLNHSAMRSVVSSESVSIVSPVYTYFIPKEEEANTTAAVTYYEEFAVPRISTIMRQLKESDSVGKQMLILSKTLQCSELDIRLRFFTAKEITYYLNRLFFKIAVMPFGSSVNGFGQKGCDLDLVCTINETSNTNRLKFHSLSKKIHFDTKAKHQEFLKIVYSLLSTCVPTISNIKGILQARVPILKFNISSSNMHCDLSAPNNCALKMSKLLYIYAEMDNRVKPLVFTIRKWAEVHRITRAAVPGPWITNFSLTLLIIFYLQTERILPSIDEVNTNESWSSAITLPLENLLCGFFQFYCTFDFKKLAICIQEGKAKENVHYSALCILNPFQHEQNVSKNVNYYELGRLIHNFQHASNLLTSNEKCSILQLLNSHETNDNTVQQKESKLENFLDLPKPTEIKEINS